MKRRLFIVVLIMTMFLPSAAAANDWETHSIYCPDNKWGCRLLQMVMMGSFDDFQPDDALNVRLFSAAYPQLCILTEEDFDHFLLEFGEEEDDMRTRYYEALANCLWADILFQGIPRSRMGNEERVLMLFLDPAGEADSEAQCREISARITEDILEQLADAVQAPLAFVQWLIKEKDMGQTMTPQENVDE